MFSKATHWLIDGLLHRERQDREAAAHQTQQAANGAAGSNGAAQSVLTSNGAGCSASSPDRQQDRVRGCCGGMHSQQRCPCLHCRHIPRNRLFLCVIWLILLMLILLMLL
jgi:hypothetical protein